MKIDEVIDNAIIALFKDPDLAKQLVLKGGSAIRLFDKINTRLSIDADFSIKDNIQHEDKFFKKVEKTLRKHFKSLEYEVFDFEYIVRPKKKKDSFPDWWRGWKIEFKLISLEFKDLNLQKKQRQAFRPEGSKKTKITIEISEYEYCSVKRKKTIKGISIQGYTVELLLLEKLRALCQQHPKYKYKTTKLRSRDFYDIYQLTQNIPDNFFEKCKKNIEKVFKAKDVDMELLNIFWEDDDFIDTQKKDFDGTTKVNIKGKVYPFETYLEHLKELIKDIGL